MFDWLRRKLSGSDRVRREACPPAPASKMVPSDTASLPRPGARPGLVARVEVAFAASRNHFGTLTARDARGAVLGGLVLGERHRRA